MRSTWNGIVYAHIDMYKKITRLYLLCSCISVYLYTRKPNMTAWAMERAIYIYIYNRRRRLATTTGSFNTLGGVSNIYINIYIYTRMWTLHTYIYIYISLYIYIYDMAVGRAVRIYTTRQVLIHMHLCIKHICIILLTLTRICFPISVANCMYICISVRASTAIMCLCKGTLIQTGYGRYIYIYTAWGVSPPRHEG